MEPLRARLPKPPSDIELSTLPVVVPLASSMLPASIQQATVDPTVLEVEDSDDEDPSKNIRTRSSSTNTLVAIKTKLIRRLSQKSESKRYSQQSLGTSDEEIARRAELKRLMHQRIQEELESEEQKEEANSNASNPEKPQPDRCSQAELPGGGPRDAIEFSVSEVHETGSNDISHVSLDIIPLAFPVREVQPSHLRRHSSCPGSTSQSRENSDLDYPGALKERGSLPQIPCARRPSSLQLAPVHSSCARGSESLCSSWRLSYSAGQLESYLGVPYDLESGEGSEFAETVPQANTTKDENEHEDHTESLSPSGQESKIDEQLSETTDQPQQVLNHNKQETLSSANASDGIYIENLQDANTDMDSPLDMWLRSQELQTNSVVSSRRNSDMMLQLIPESPSQEARLTASQDFDGTKPRVRNSHGPSDSIYLSQHDLPGAWPHSHSSHSDAESASIYQHKGLPQAITKRRSAPDNANSGLVGRIPQELSSHYTSSRYTTRTNSRQPTPKESRLSLIGVFGARKATPPFAPFHRIAAPNNSTEVEKSDGSSYKTAPNEISTSESAMPFVQDAQRPTIETASGVLSETASFKQREEELRSIEKRFGQVHVHRNPYIPVVSRFHEEFNEARGSGSVRQSLFTKLHLPLPKRTKHSTRDVEDGKQVSLNESSNFQGIRNTTSRWQGSVSPEIGHDEAQQHMEGSSNTFSQRPLGQRRVSFPISKQDTTDTRKPDSEHIIPSVISIPGLKSPKVEQGSMLKPPPRLENNSSPRSDISSFVLKKWVDQLDSEDSQPQEPRGEVQPHIPRRYRTPPASWARWPSHTRHERVGPAGEGDSVISKDFALRVESGGSRMTWATDKPGEPSQRDATPSPRTLSSRFGQVVKDRVSRILRGKDPLETNSRDSPEVYPGKSDGYLEYPELEILPMRGGYKELQALEQQIDNMKHGSASSRYQQPLSSADSTKPPLAVWLAEEIHKVRHGDDESSSQNGDELIDPLPELQTPSEILTKPRLVSNTTQQLETTPHSNVYYDDCVLKHMLEDEERSDQSMSMAIGERPRAKTTPNLTSLAISMEVQSQAGNETLMTEGQRRSWYGKSRDSRQPPLPRLNASTGGGDHNRKAPAAKSSLTGVETKRKSKENQCELLTRTPSTSTI
ncbi:hypothetical protein F4779DRAFT_644031 [Xylariaceae sp. FL0662B]|nr:hypothetical protein F4779DRAFT_644031 [Xylariaceae sp. FL0662B]